MSETLDAITRLEASVKQLLAEVRQLRNEHQKQPTVDAETLLPKLRAALRQAKSFTRRSGDTYVRMTDVKMYMGVSTPTRQLSALARTYGLRVVAINGLIAIEINAAFLRLAPPLAPVK